jgi:hypothetical protein
MVGAMKEKQMNKHEADIVKVILQRPAQRTHIYLIKQS